MATCPHCSKDGIAILAKWWSGSGGPAKCRVCGGSSYVTEDGRFDINFKASAIVLVALATAFLSETPWIAAVGVVAAFVYYTVRWQRVAMVGITDSEASQNTKWGWGFLAAIVLLSLVYASTQI